MRGEIPSWVSRNKLLQSHNVPQSKTMSQGALFSSSAFDGRWQMRSGTFAGEAIPELVCSNTEFRLAGANYAFVFGGEIIDAGGLVWDEAGPELSATLHCQKGANEGRRTACSFTGRGQLLRLSCAFPDPADPSGKQRNYTALFSRITSA